MATEEPGDPLLRVADDLYALPPGQFTAARDAAAKEHRADKELAARVKALRRPSVAAWAVNLLVRREAEQVGRLLAVGEALREAQADLDATQLRELTRQRRALTAAVAGRARAAAADEGQRLSDAARQQVEDTLTAAMLDAGAAAAVRSGLLVAPLSATGVDAVDVAPALAVPEALGFAAPAREAAPPTKPELRVVPDPDAEEKARRAAQEALAEAEASLSRRTEELERAVEEVGTREAHSLQVQAEIDEVRRRLAELEAALEEAEDALGEAEDLRDEAEAAVAEATRERDAAAARLERA
jgi:hypothetical protein